MPRLVTLATCNLNQWAMDFVGNKERILASIYEAKRKGARFRLGPELEVPGYGCEDHFLEEDTYIHSWEVIEDILKTDATDNILCDVGMPIQHRGVRYNCRVYLLNRQVVLIRPKMYLANDGNYRETRWFAAWSGGLVMQEHYLPRNIQAITKQFKVPIGIACIATRDSVIAAETCEELFTANSPHIFLTLSGAEIIANGSGSHHTLRKRDKRMDLMRNASSKCGGVYMYANQRGCDGSRLYFDGTSMIYMNGDLMSLASQFSLQDVEVVTATVDLTDIRSYRGAIASRNVQAAQTESVVRIDADFFLSETDEPYVVPSQPLHTYRTYTAEEEIGYGPACWLWDYLRRSKLSGFFLPLSGGADSSSVCAMVGIMCDLVVEAVMQGNEQVLADVRRITKLPDLSKENISRQKIANKMFHCAYMGHSAHSSKDTLLRAQNLAAEVGASFHAVTIDTIVDACVGVFGQISANKPNIEVANSIQNIAMQNIQARTRMILSYFFSQLLVWDRSPTEKFPGQLLVLGASNVDEALRGYYTKYDCSAADINPIGSICKEDLKRFLKWCGTDYPNRFPTLSAVVSATPTAELQPMKDGEVAQTDEDEMGMSYKELSRFGFLRGVMRCGPVSMFCKLVHEWPTLEPQVVSDKVKRFFKFYAINRHKMTTLTPSYHAENYSPDDNRYDLRQFLYDVNWTWQFSRLDAACAHFKALKEHRSQL